MDSLKPICAKMLGKKEIKVLHKKVTQKKLFLVTFLIVTCFLAGCVTLPDPETAQDFNQDQVAIVKPDQAVGQTFIARRARLNGIDLWLKTDHPGDLLTVELFHDIGGETAVFAGTLRSQDGKNSIPFPPLDDPPHQGYYLRLSSTQGETAILGRNEDNYTHGTAHLNDQPIEADLAFRTTYEYDAGTALADFRGMVSTWYLILPLGIVLLLPGWLLLDFSNLKQRFDWGERVGLSLGLSLATIPLLMLWTTLVGLRWGNVSLWVVSLILIALTIWRAYHNSKRQSSPAVHFHPSYIILVMIFALTLFTRFAMVRDLAAPPWVDSIHHGLITRLMLENGGLPETYAPYLPLEADYYHFGFHSALASFTWLTGLEIYEGMLIFGQVLNAMIVFAIYLLTKTLTKNRPAALMAALISGVFTLMPAYYVSWGRYTQLAGLLVLPAAFTIFVEISKNKSISPGKNKPLWLLGAVLFAGLFLIHYRVAAFLAVLILAYWFAQINWRGWLKTSGQLFFMGIFGAILLLPWLPGTISNLLLPKGVAWSGGKENFSAIPWNFLKPALGETALILAGIGLILGIILLKRFPLTVILWTGMMYLLANMGIFGLPGSGFVNPVSLEITLFMPIAILGGFAVGGGLVLFDKFIPDRCQIAPRMGFAILGVASAILGVQRLLPTLNPITFLAREADFPAIQWITKNISEGETILINPTDWGYGLKMGNDGGYWISPLSNHPTMPPPVLYGLGDVAEVARINQFIEGVQSSAADAEALWKLLRTENIHFVFTGARGGVISPQVLSESSLFKIRYSQQGVWLFEILDAAQ